MSALAAPGLKAAVRVLYARPVVVQVTGAGSAGAILFLKAEVAKIP